MYNFVIYYKIKVFGLHVFLITSFSLLYLNLFENLLFVTQQSYYQTSFKIIIKKFV